MNEKWMPGPWEVDPTTTCTSVRRVGPLDHGARYRVATVGSMNRKDEVDIATARLIAAAPDLYAVLNAIISELPISRERAKDVLKKARGES